jgi:hypothetical protein
LKNIINNKLIKTRSNICKCPAWKMYGEPPREHGPFPETSIPLDVPNGWGNNATPWDEKAWHVWQLGA